MLLPSLLVATALANLVALVSSMPTSVELVTRSEYEILDLQERFPDIGPVIEDIVHARANNEIITKGIEVGASIAEAGCGSGNPITCGIAVVGGLFFAFFAYYVGSNSPRDSTFQLVTDYPPLPGCNHRCRLWNDAPEGDWRSIGNVTVNGIFHDLHYYRAGDNQGLRVYQYENGVDVLSKRQAVYDDAGMVGDYYWWAGYEAAYDSFDSNSDEIEDFADAAVNDLQWESTICMCTSFADSTGILSAGLLTIGWNGQPFEFYGDEFYDDQDTCDDADWGRRR